MLLKKTNTITGGAIVTVAMRWVDRLIGIVSTFILARLLVPDDFGIIAMASVAVTFADIIFGLGINVAIIQSKNPSQAFYNTAWTLRIIQTACVALFLMILAPFAADYYKDPRVLAVVQVMALSLLVNAFENVGIINFQKEMRFVEDARFVLFKRLVGFAITVVMTIILDNYWGMVIGTLGGRLVSTARSYLVHPMRPRFALSEFRAIFSVSQWVLVQNISYFLDRKLHVILVGGIATTGVTGGYTLASEISSVPSTDLLAPINRVLFPAFARASNNLAELIKLLVRAQAVQVMVTFPACVGFVMTAQELVPVALGEKWMFIIPFIQILALSNIIQSISSSANYVLTVIGKIRLLAITNWIQVAVFIVGTMLLWSDLDAERIALVRLAAIVLTFGVSYAILMRYLPGLTLSLLMRGTGRPLLGCLAMVVALLALQVEFHAAPGLMLLFKIGTGFVVYCSVVISLWILAKRPAGAESYFLDKLTRTLPAHAGVSDDAT